MAYAAIEDLEREAGGRAVLTELTDLDGTGTQEVSLDVLDAAIADADAMIDTYIGRNQSVPLQAPIPRIVRRMSASEALFLLRQRRGMVGDFERERHALNLKWLEDAARGAVTLGVEPGPQRSELVAAQVVEVADDARIDTAAALKGLW